MTGADMVGLGRFQALARPDVLGGRFLLAHLPQRG